MVKNKKAGIPKIKKEETTQNASIKKAHKSQFNKSMTTYMYSCIRETRLYGVNLRVTCALPTGQTLPASVFPNDELIRVHLCNTPSACGGP